VAAHFLILLCLVLNQDGRTALIAASGEGHTSLVPLLLDAGADVNLADNVNQTSFNRFCTCLIESRCLLTRHEIISYTIDCLAFDSIWDVFTCCNRMA
jgi:ankyrin repeat protein